MSAVLDRLLGKATVGAPGSCWEWHGRKGRRGYGRIKLDGREIQAHRVAYTLLVGPIPDGLVIDHLCSNTSCINPSHLEPVTQRVNLHRAQSINVAHAAKTHCPSGHPYDEDNTRIGRHRTRTGRIYRTRVCRTCHNDRTRARNRRVGK